MMELLTTGEAAKRLRVTPIRVRQMIREGKIEAKQIGRDYVIAESSLESVKTYGKAGRPKKTQDGGSGAANGKDEPFKTIFEVAPESAGSLDGESGNLSTDESFGAKKAESGKSAAKTEKPAQTAFDIAGDLMNRLLAKQRDLPPDLSTNKDYLNDLGQKSAEKKRNNES